VLFRSGEHTQHPEIIYGTCRPCQSDVPTPAACDLTVCSKCGDRLDGLVEPNRRGSELDKPEQELSAQNAGSKITHSTSPSGKCETSLKSPSACSLHSVGSDKNLCEPRSRSPKASSKCPSETLKAECDVPSRSQSACTPKAQSCSRAPSRSESACFECPSKACSTQSAGKSHSNEGVTSQSVRSKSSRRDSSDRLTTDSEPLYTVRTDDCLPNIDTVPCRGPLQLRPQSPCRWLANASSTCAPCRHRCSSSLPEPTCWNSCSSGRDRFRSFPGRELRDSCYYRRAFSCGNTPDNIYRAWSPCRYHYGNTRCSTLRCLQHTCCYSSCAVCYRGVTDDQMKRFKKENKGRKSRSALSSRSARSRMGRKKNTKSGHRTSSRSSESDKNKNKKIKRRKSGSGRNTGAMTKGSQSSVYDGLWKSNESDSQVSSCSRQDSNIVSVTAHACQSRRCSTEPDTGRGAAANYQCSEDRDSIQSKRASRSALRKKVSSSASGKSKQTTKKSVSPKQNSKEKEDRNKGTKKPILKSSRKPAKSDGGSKSSAQNSSDRASARSSAKSSAQSSARSTDRSSDRSSASKSSTVRGKRNEKKQRRGSERNDSKKTNKSKSKTRRRSSSTMSSHMTNEALMTSPTSCQSGTSSYKTKTPPRRRRRSSSSPRKKSRRRSRGRKSYKQAFSSSCSQQFSSPCVIRSPCSQPYSSPCRHRSPFRQQFSPSRRQQLDSRRSCIDRNVDLADCLVGYMKAAYMDNFRAGSGHFPPPPVRPVQPCMSEYGPRERFSVNPARPGACVGRQFRNPIQFSPSVPQERFNNRRMFPVVPASSCNSSLSFYSLGWEADCIRPPPSQQHPEHNYGHAAVVPLKSEIQPVHQPKSVTIAEPSASSGRHGNEGQPSSTPAALVWSKETADPRLTRPRVSGTRKEVSQTSAPGHAVLVRSKETVDPKHTNPQVSETRRVVPQSSAPGHAILVWSKETVDPKHTHPQVSGTRREVPQSSTPGQAVLVWSKETAEPTQTRPQDSRTRKEVPQSSTPGQEIHVRSKETVDPKYTHPQISGARKEVPQSSTPGQAILVWSKETVDSKHTHPQIDGSRNQVRGQIAGQRVREVRKDSMDDFRGRVGTRQNDNSTATGAFVGQMDSSKEMSSRQETQQRQTVTTTTTTHHRHHHHGHQYSSTSDQQNPASRNSAEFIKSGLGSEDGRKSMHRGVSQPRSNSSRPLDDPLLVQVSWSGKNASSNATRPSRVSTVASNFRSETPLMLVRNQNNDQAENRSWLQKPDGVASAQSVAIADSRESSRFDTSLRRQQHIEQMKQVQQMKQLNRKREMDEAVDETVKSISQSFSSSQRILK